MYSSQVNRWKQSIYNVLKRHLSVTEVKIPVPWGHIAGKRWRINESSTSSAKPVLCLHGWKDNAASFDKLMISLSKTPLAKQPYEFFCVDLPGHGFSSHYSPGMVYSCFDSLIWIFRVVRHFGWDQSGKANLTIMGHSVGGVISFLFATTHNHLIENLIGIDGVTPVIFSHDDMIRITSMMTEHILAMDDQQSEGRRASYSKEEILQKMRSGHMMAFDEETCQILMQRGVVKDPEDPEKFKFAHDIRVQYLPIVPLSHRQVSYLAENYKGGFLQIKAMEGVNYESNYMKLHLAEWIKKHNSDKKLTVVSIEKAPHHVHMSHSDIVAQHISDFLL